MATLQTCEASMRVHDSKPAYRSNVNARQALAAVAVVGQPAIPADMFKQHHDVPSPRSRHQGRRACSRELAQPVASQIEVSSNFPEQFD
jgi:hypothetical protein